MKKFIVILLIFFSGCITIRQSVYINDRDIATEEKEVETTDVETDVAEAMEQRKQTTINTQGGEP